jgi:hypothetical protein
MYPLLLGLLSSELLTRDRQLSPVVENVAGECKVPGFDDPKANYLALIKAWLSSERSGKWLMIMDNSLDCNKDERGWLPSIMHFLVSFPNLWSAGSPSLPRSKLPNLSGASLERNPLKKRESE